MTSRGLLVSLALFSKDLARSMWFSATCTRFLRNSCIPTTSSQPKLMLAGLSNELSSGETNCFERNILVITNNFIPLSNFTSSSCYTPITSCRNTASTTHLMIMFVLLEKKLSSYTLALMFTANKRLDVCHPPFGRKSI